MKPLIAALLALCMLLPGCLEDEPVEEAESPWNGAEIPDDQWAPIFTVESMDGELWSMEEQHGKVVVLAFVYTRCEDICPIISASLKYSQTLLDEHELENLTYVSITIDPYHDSPSVMQNWTADKGYNDESDEGYGFNHTQPTYLIDAEGYLRVVWTDPNLPPDLFIEDVRGVLSL
jgi:cytochrome oxidase Cu insertion factor (SCO1/SenC/PrrC family)